MIDREGGENGSGYVQRNEKEKEIWKIVVLVIYTKIKRKENQKEKLTFFG